MNENISNLTSKSYWRSERPDSGPCLHFRTRNTWYEGNSTQGVKIGTKESFDFAGAKKVSEKRCPCTRGTRETSRVATQKDIAAKRAASAICRGSAGICQGQERPKLLQALCRARLALGNLRPCLIALLVVLSKFFRKLISGCNN